MKKSFVYLVLITIFSVVCGIITKDYFIGTIILASGLLNSYYASNGKIATYFFWLLYCFFAGYVAFINGLYALAGLSLFVYIPLQIQGYFSWKNSKNEKDDVKVRGFTVKVSFIVVFLCVSSSLLLGYLLNLIPTQQLAFLDSSSNMINLSAVVLMNLRYKECWMIWLFNNTIDLVIWIINAVKGSPNAYMMLLVSIGYLLINVYGLIKWINMSRYNKKHKIAV